MADITTIYGYKNQFTFYIENNGANPITVRSVELVNVSGLVANNVFTELENSLPMVVAGNSQLDVITNWYSLNYNDYSSDLIYSITYDIVDMTDFTTIMDTTTIDVSFDLVNSSILNPTAYELLSKLNKHFRLGPNGIDTTIGLNQFTSTGYPVIEFSDRMKFHLFIMKYRPQFVVFNNVTNRMNLIVGTFYYNYERNSIECYFTDNEKAQIIGLVFNNIYLLYSDA